MTSKELREKFIKFFEGKGHKVLPSSSLIPEDDPSVLLTTAGMQQFKKWFSGIAKPQYDKVATIQKCVRIGDIEEVGDNTHLSFFEMLGNFAFDSSYWKKEAVHWGIEFIERELGILFDRLDFSYFKGEDGLSEDNESLDALRALGITEDRILRKGKEDNFWGPTGDEGPCGPTVEIYVDGIEVWNLVFNEYYRTKDGKYGPLKSKGVDTGAGFERVLAVINGKESVYDTDLFTEILAKIKKLAEREDKHSERVIADHLRASTFMLADDIRPSNLDKGYVLRRLIRRAIRHGRILEIEQKFCSKIAEVVIDDYKESYPELEKNREVILAELKKEEEKFQQTIESGLKATSKLFSSKESINKADYLEVLSRLEKKELFREIYRGNYEKLQELSPKLTKEQFIKATINGKEAFNLYQTYGFPIEIIIELAQEKGLFVDVEGFRAEFEKHQEISRKGAEKKFKGGLETGGEIETKYHTATHLLHKALKVVLGDHVKQAGSNITAERLRFDFTHPEKMTPEEITEVENLVNEQIKASLPVSAKEMSAEEAKKKAVGLFEEKYGEKVTVYSIGEPGKEFSVEICGGPHVKNTSELGTFKIVKEESSSAGVRRIKAVLE
ncbi:MAG: alanine--tRNA ligase-related protein [Patescibacteria group bacterium]|nr:alanine--tRNA ligase-related protein [Patescibacteria group bacterium]